jgi:sugar/nucleoside kinase (ribokinase family)
MYPIISVMVGGVPQMAAAAGVPVFLDCGGDEAAIGAELLSLVTYISPNETELQRITGGWKSNTPAHFERII